MMRVCFTDLFLPWRAPRRLTLNALVRFSSLDAFEGEQHVEITGTRFAEGYERLIFGRVVPTVKGIHVWKLDDYNPLWFPVTTLRQSMASAFGQVTPAILRHH